MSGPGRGARVTTTPGAGRERGVTAAAGTLIAAGRDVARTLSLSRNGERPTGQVDGLPDNGPTDDELPEMGSDAEDEQNPGSEDGYREPDPHAVRHRAPEVSIQLDSTGSAAVDVHTVIPSEVSDSALAALDDRARRLQAYATQLARAQADVVAAATLAEAYQALRPLRAKDLDSTLNLGDGSMFSRYRDEGILVQLAFGAVPLDFFVWRSPHGRDGIEQMRTRETMLVAMCEALAQAPTSDGQAQREVFDAVTPADAKWDTYRRKWRRPVEAALQHRGLIFSYQRGFPGLRMEALSAQLQEISESPERPDALAKLLITGCVVPMGATRCKRPQPRPLEFLS